MALIGGADREPAPRENSRSRHEINRAVSEQARRARTDEIGRVDLDDCLQIFAQRKIESDARANLVRQVERAVAVAEALNDAATDTERAQVHIFGPRVAFLDESDVGAEIDVLGQAAVKSRNHTKIKSPSATPAFETGVQFSGRRNL